MSSHKADQRYTQRYDDLPVSASSSESDEEASLLPRPLFAVRRDWMSHYADEIDFLYGSYIHWGREVFGKAFHQLGTVQEFAHFVFKYMQPGAN